MGAVPRRAHDPTPGGRHALAGIGAGVLAMMLMTALLAAIVGARHDVGIGPGQSLLFAAAVVAGAAMFAAVGALTGEGRWQGVGQGPRWATEAIGRGPRWTTEATPIRLDLGTMKQVTSQTVAAPTLRRPGSPIRAAIYVRISQDREGAGLGIARQEEDCRAQCERKGWIVVMVYVDNDVSAYSGRPRKQWLRLLADIQDGRIDAIVCWHVDRLTRTPRELEDVIDLHDQRGIQLATVTGEIDLSTPTGRLVARTLGAAARHESEHKGERQRRAARQAAEQGKPARAGQRGYGYAADKVTIIDAEAKVIRECAHRVLAGESARAVAADLNTRGLATAAGKPWNITALKGVLISARISGRREYTGKETYDNNTRPALGEITATGTWPAIITPAQSDRLRALLTTPARGSAHTARRYLLSAVFHCGRCGHPMYGRNHNGKPRYQCLKDPGKPGCGKVAVYAHRADDTARDKILTALQASPALLPALIRRHQAGAATGDSEDIGQKLRLIDERRNELAAAWAEQEISRKEWATAKRVLDAKAEQLTRQLARSTHALALAEFAVLDGDMWQRWQDPKMTGSARRALIQACVTAITVHPANGKQWSPDRIDPQWLT